MKRLHVAIGAKTDNVHASIYYAEDTSLRWQWWSQRNKAGKRKR
jgi:hypothetical protein